MTATLVLVLREALARRRLLVLNIAIPLILVAPVALSAAPAHHAAAVYAVLFVLFGTFGAAIPLVRDSDRGLLFRIALTGIEPRGHLAGRLAAQTVIDSAQLLPAVLLILVTGPGGRGATALPLVLPLALAAANALGVAVAGVARSIGEAAMFCAVVALLALHGAGVFRTPAPDSPGAAVEAAIPFSYLHEALRAAAGAGTARADLGLVAAALPGTAAVTLLVVAAAPILLTALARIPR